MKRGLLWVEVTKDTVRIHTGGTMPHPTDSIFYSWIGENRLSRKEFARWSGVRFAAPGIYALACNFAIISRYREVKETRLRPVKEVKRQWVKI